LIRVDPTKRYGVFLFLTLLSDSWRDLVSRNILSGATVDRIPLSKLPDFPITSPPLELVARFDEAVRPIVDDQTRLRGLAANLRNTRDLLLPRLLSGQLSLEDAA
jgi:type I restriction enzyme S subunit